MLFVNASQAAKPRDAHVSKIVLNVLSFVSAIVVKMAENVKKVKLVKAILMKTFLRKMKKTCSLIFVNICTPLCFACCRHHCLICFHFILS